ncbi:MAG: D-alanine--D-alanine ligase [Candidatus Paceibacterota bacterium]|jgi:D-alanine-D-alanine ligase
MAKNKLKIGVVFGGKSVEHEVSLLSAQNVINALDKSKYEIVPISIDKMGKWLLNVNSNYLLNNNNAELIKLNKSSSKEVVLLSHHSGNLTDINNTKSSQKLDVIFPVLHGAYGEDGSIQGLLKLAGVPFVGAGVLGSAVGMDKDVMKRLLKEASIPIGEFLVFKIGEKISFQKVKRFLDLPIFIKPANTGSSVGVKKVTNEKEFKDALKNAFQYDLKIVIEKEIKGQEIECSVLGNDMPMASIPGEVIPKNDFYSYEAKYIRKDGATILIPANISKNTTKKVQSLAIKVFKTLNCEGMARVDFFVKKNGEVLVNEINTLPGFTAISMYPKMWEASGLPIAKLLDKLIELAIERFNREQKLKTTVK